MIAEVSARISAKPLVMRCLSCRGAKPKKNIFEIVVQIFGRIKTTF